MNSGSGRRNRFSRLREARDCSLEHHQIQHLLRSGWEGPRLVWNRTVELLLGEPCTQFQRTASPGDRIIASPRGHLLCGRETIGHDEARPHTLCSFHITRDEVAPIVRLDGYSYCPTAQGRAVHVPSISIDLF
jgi:hypothetical protein